MEVLQTSALPLGYHALVAAPKLERVMGIEPTAFSMARRRSTSELHPRQLQINKLTPDCKELNLS